MNRKVLIIAGIALFLLLLFVASQKDSVRTRGPQINQSAPSISANAFF